VAVTDRLHCYVRPATAAALADAAAAAGAGGARGANDGDDDIISPKLPPPLVDALVPPFIEYKDSDDKRDSSSLQEAAESDHSSGVLMLHWSELQLSREEMSSLLYSHLTQATGSDGHVVDGHWTEFLDCWAVLRHIEGEFWWDELLPLMLRQLSDDHVTYLEVKTALISARFDSMDALDAWLEETLLRFIEVVHAHRENYDPSWLGAKLVFVGIKSEDPAALGDCMRRLVPLVQRHPGWVAGIDLAGAGRFLFRAICFTKKKINLSGSGQA
jgi:hypothetical protein